jgi:hypothetical protein
VESVLKPAYTTESDFKKQLSRLSVFVEFNMAMPSISVEDALALYKDNMHKHRAMLFEPYDDAQNISLHTAYRHYDAEFQALEKKYLSGGRFVVEMVDGIFEYAKDKCFRGDVSKDWGSDDFRAKLPVLLAKIAFFLPNAIIIVLFPKMTAGKSRRTVYIATGLTAFVGLIITGFSLLFGEFVIRVLGGAQYVELGLGTEAWLFALEGSAFALVQVLLYARLAAEDKRAAASVWIALVVLVGIISIWRHDSVVEIVTTVVAVSLVLTLVGLLLDWRGGREGSEVEPIEMAE